MDTTRYVIKNPKEGYFTEMYSSEQVPVYLGDRLMGHNYKYLPKFDAFKPSQATQFDTEADALEFIKNPKNGGAAAFPDCTVEAH